MAQHSKRWHYCKFVTFFYLLLAPIFEVKAIPLADLEDPQFRARLVLDAGAYRLEINPKTASSGLSAKAFVLNAPERVVIDVKGLSASGMKKKTIGDNRIAALRFAGHPGSVRFVLDVASGRASDLQAKASSENGTIIVRMKGDALPLKAANKTVVEKPSTTTLAPSKKKPAATAKAPIVPPTSTTTTTSTSSSTTLRPRPTTTTTTQTTTTVTTTVTSTLPPKTVAPTPKTTSTTMATLPPPSTPQKTQALESTSTSTESTFASRTSAPPMTAPTQVIRLGETPKSDEVPSAKIQSISFQVAPESGEPAVVLETNELKNYAFTQTRSYIYEVLLEKTSLANSTLSGTKFPPKNLDKRGFEAIAVHQQNADVSIRIYVRDGAKLVPVRVGNKLWVKLGKS